MNTKQQILTLNRELQHENFDKKDPLTFLISTEEYLSLKKEYAREVRDLSYEEYLEIEQQCWNDMLRDLMLPEWEKRFSNFKFGRLPNISLQSFDEISVFHSFSIFGTKKNETIRGAYA